MQFSFVSVQEGSLLSNLNLAALMQMQHKYSKSAFTTSH